MTILIKGMEVPMRCGDCLFYGLESAGHGMFYDFCKGGKFILCSPDNEIDENCPLVPVPTPHGGLIDEKWIKEYITDTIKGFEEMNRSDLQNYSLIAGLRTVEVMIEHAPTVIEAEEVEGR